MPWTSTSTATPPATRWRGERMDYELGVWTLCAQEERARRLAGARVHCATFPRETLETFEATDDFAAGLQ